MLNASDIFSDARAVLNDAAGARYTDAILLPMFNAVQRELYSLRPDCVLFDDDTSLVVDPPTPADGSDDTLSISDKWRGALVEGLLAKAFQIDDDEHPANAQGMGAYHRQSFLQQAGGL
jgi:hypothetical protein